MFKNAVVSILLLFVFSSAPYVQTTPEAEYPPLAAEEIIYQVNSIRTSHGLKPLEVSSILMSVAQSTAEIMAANHMMGHIGDVRGRVMEAGYGGGEAAWATENFAVFSAYQPQYGLLDAWGDAAHMIPMENGTYRHIGVGIARDGDVYYYVLQAAYTSSNAWQPYYSTTPGQGTPVGGVTDTGMSEWMSPVITSTPQENGTIIHVVQPGQTLWSIAIAYNTKILDILAYNNLPADMQTIYAGQILVMPVTAVPLPTQTPTILITLPGTPSSTTTPTMDINLTQSTPTAAPPSVDEREVGIRNILLFLLGLSALFFFSGWVFKSKSR